LMNAYIPGQIGAISERYFSMRLCRAHQIAMLQLNASFVMPIICWPGPR
jgi:hypothetical protein